MAKGSGVKGRADTPGQAPARTAPRSAKRADPTRNAQGANIGGAGGGTLTTEGASHEAARKAAKLEPPVDRDRKVRATRPGYYGHLRRYAGDVFVLRKGDKRGSWMQFVDENTPEKKSTANDDIRNHHDRVMGGRVAGGARDNSADLIGTAGSAHADLDEDE